MSDKDLTKKFNEYQDKLRKTSIVINRIPEKYKTEFMKIAKEEFANDYGLLLRELIRTWQGIFVDPNEELKIKIDMLANEFVELKEFVLRTAKKSETKEEFIVTADGTKIKKPNMEDKKK